MAGYDIREICPSDLQRFLPLPDNCHQDQWEKKSKTPTHCFEHQASTLSIHLHLNESNSLQLHLEAPLCLCLNDSSV